MKKKLWTKERCLREALRFKDFKSFRVKSKKAYKASYRNGWLEEVTKHMTFTRMKHGGWTKENCLNEASKYRTPSEFRKKASGAYSKCIDEGWLKEATKHMKRQVQKPRNYWTKENCLLEALKYNTPNDFKKTSPTAYRKSVESGWLEEITQHMTKRKAMSIGYWSKEKCLEEAQRYTLRSEFKKGSPVVYQKCISNKWLKQATSHMKKVVRYNLLDAKNLAKERGGRCLSKKYSGAGAKLKWICQNGHKWEAKFAQLNNQKTWCGICHRLKLEEERKTELIFKLNSFYSEFHRVPKRREFDHYLPERGSSNAARTYWGTFNNFVRANGYDENFGMFGNIWRIWENLVYDILKDKYPGVEIYQQFYNKENQTLVDFYIPSLELAVDAKTSNYNIQARNTQSEKYIRQYKRVHFYCLDKDESQPERKGIEYIYGSDLIKSLKSKKLIKRLNELLEQDEKFKLENGLITKREILSEIKLLAQELRRTPQMREFQKDPRFSNPATVIKLFGTWNNAIVEAGLEPRKQFSAFMTSESAISQFKKAVKLYKNKYNHFPNNKEYLEFSYKNDVISWKLVRSLTKLTYSELNRKLDFKIPRKKHPKLKSLDEIKDIAHKKGLVLVSKKFLGNKSKIKLKCLMHNKVITKTLYGLKKSKTSCPECYRLHMSNKFKANFDQVEKRINDLGFVVLNKDKFEGIRMPLEMKCIQCGYTIFISPVSLYRKKSCSICKKI